ncbi:hypothetical protein Prudu_002549 [Prunus dulcis]|uniref:CCHC-type domain-containing protein n=1 Tax=Prunus dulcis TaxID=3755 RepID=A0A4Y1QR16_PRUDU|nr:hypothetical protein Prudu_002549 [Prunus dulcis]
MSSGAKEGPSVSYSILPIFGGGNYNFWKVKMRTILLSEGLWSFVERGLQEPEDLSQLPAAEIEKFEAEVMKDAKALSKIQNGVTSDIFPRITRAKTAKEAWDTLEKEFQGDSKAITIKLQTLRREFYNMKMKESECIQDYASRLAEVVNQMRTLGEEISDQRVVEKILISLPEKYDPIVAAIEECKDITTLSIEQLMGSLKSHEQRRLTRNDQSVESAFQSKLSFKSQKSSKKGNSRDDQRTGEQRRWKKGESSKRDESKNGKSTNSEDNQPSCRICNKTNHDTSNCWNRGKPKCHHCNKFGHVEKNCRFKKANQANFSESKNDDDGNENLFSTCLSALEEKESIWYLDSGCSNHMSGNENIFLDVDTSATPNIKMGNGAIVEAKGKGRIAVKTKKGMKQIHDVLLVPKLSQNLLSVGQLVENGYRLVFQDGACIIYDKNAVEMVIAKVKMERNRNFPIEFQYAEVAAMKADVVQDSWLWHKRFCHLNFQGLKLLQKNSMVNGLPEIKETTDVNEGSALIPTLPLNGLSSQLQ